MVVRALRSGSLDKPKLCATALVACLGFSWFRSSLRKCAQPWWWGRHLDGSDTRDVDGLL